MAVASSRRLTTRPVRSRPVGVAAVCALGFGLIVEAAPVVGSDLAAQTWWISWAESVGSPVDLG